MARREAKVDAELLARLESGGSDKIRVPLPHRKVNEMFAIAEQILGGRRVTVLCAEVKPEWQESLVKCAAGNGFEMVI